MTKPGLLTHASLFAAAIAFTTPAWAQVSSAVGDPEASAQTSDEGAEAEEIVVTGSLIRGTPEDAALPVDVISAEELLKQGSPSPVELLKALPTSNGVIGDSNQFDSRSQGAEGIASVNLRGLGPQRTLVLLNNRRLVAAGNGVPAVDINLLPQAAIGRIEILKDGAAATYGSDAIAGVVNFITRTNQEGFLASASYKFIDGSKGDYDGSLSFGHSQDGFRMLVAGGFQHRSELLSIDRDFAVRPYAENPEGGFSSGGNPTVFLPVAATGAPLGALRADASCTALGGQLLASGTLAAPVANTRCATQFTPFDALTDTENRFQLYGEVEVDVTPDVQFEVSALFGYSNVPHYRTSPSYLLTQAPSPASLPTPSPIAFVPGFFVPANNPGFQVYRTQNPGTIPATAAGAVFPLLLFRPYLAGGNPAKFDEGKYG